MNKTESATKKLLVELAKISNFYGSNPDYVLAGGGNTSIKIDNSLYIKGSGTELATVRPEDFVGLNREKVSATLQKEYSKDPYEREEEIKNDLLAARLHPEKGGRPSVETALHNMFQAQFVVHLHPWWVNTLTCAQDGKKVAQKLLGDSAIWLEYTDPGFILAKAVEKAITAYRKAHKGNDPDYLIIQNHGPFIPAKDPADAKAKISRLYKAINAYHAGKPKNPLGQQKFLVKQNREEMIQFFGPALRALLAEGPALKAVLFDDSPLVMEFVATEKGRECIQAGPLTPDQIVYCKSFPLWISFRDGESMEKVAGRMESAIKAFRSKRKYDPKVVIVEGLGMFTVGDTPKAAQTSREIYYDAMKIMKGAYAAGKPHFLNPRQYGFIDDWEVEQYRRKVAAAAAGAAGAMQNRVAVVVNADQNPGKDIAISLASEGACVILVGSNATALNKAAEAATANSKKGSSIIGLKGDVSSSNYVRIALTTIARKLGGVDLLVFPEAAGEANTIAMQTDKEYARVCQNNMVGYFLWAKGCSRMMRVQAACSDDFMGDIVQVAADFDAVGLTLRFSGELVGEGIKVNTIMAMNAEEKPKKSADLAKEILRTLYHMVNEQKEGGVILGAGHTTDHEDCGCGCEDDDCDCHASGGAAS